MESTKMDKSINSSDMNIYTDADNKFIAKAGIIDVTSSFYTFKAVVVDVTTYTTFENVYSGKVIAILSYNDNPERFFNKIVHFNKDTFAEISLDEHPEYLL